MSITHIVDGLIKQPRYTLMRAMARFESVRNSVTNVRSRIYSARTRQILTDCERRMSESVFRGVDIHKIVQDLHTDGLAHGLQLPREIVDNLCSYAEKETCYAFRKPSLGFRVKDRAIAEEKLGKPILLAQYFNTTNKNDLIAKLSNDPTLIWVAASYLESPPVFVGANMWWTFPVQASEKDRDKHAHFFHRDVDDFRFFKFFFYLTDVEEGEGAHVCVVTSHQAAQAPAGLGMKKLRRFSDPEVSEGYGLQKIVEISGKSGIGFAENTLCIHKGKTPTNKPRLLLQLQYALFDYGVMHDEKNYDLLANIS